MTNQEIAQEALHRATASQAWTNYPTIFEGFTLKGIPEHEIEPRVNVFTYHAWRALGRQVKKGEKGVKVTTWINCTKKVKGDNGEEEEKHYKRPKMTTVFHISQTDLV